MLKNNRGIILIISLFFLTKLFLIFFQENVWWDSAVYTGMGKYLFSYGNSGLWESSRPLIWPLILGFFWKLGFNILFFRILELFFAIGCIYLTYLISKNIFNKKVALLSALFLAFSPTFYFFSGILLSEIISLFFALLSVYFFINKKYFLAGLLSGFAFMARFLQLFAFIAMFFILAFNYKKNRLLFKDFLNIVSGFFIVTFPYLLFNYIIYNNAFYPFILQSFLTKNTGFVFHQPFQFYFINLLRENILILASIPGLYLIIKNNADFKQITIASVFSIFFIFLNFINHKEMRILIVALPYLYIIAAYTIIYTAEKIKTKNILFYSFIALIFSIWLLQSFGNIYALEYKELQQKNKYAVFQDYLRSDNVKGNIWISNPAFALYTDKKINELIYYPAFNTAKYNELKSKLKQGNHVLVDTCDIACEPVAAACQSEKEEFLSLLEESFSQAYYSKIGNCRKVIFAK